MEVKIAAIAISIMLVIPSISAAADKDWRKKCDSVGETAHITMRARQSGVPLPDVMEAAGGNKLFEAMASEAYGSPRFATNEYKEAADNDFRDKWYLDCYRVLSGE